MQKFRTHLDQSLFATHYFLFTAHFISKNLQCIWWVAPVGSLNLYFTIAKQLRWSNLQLVVYLHYRSSTSSSCNNQRGMIHPICPISPLLWLSSWSPSCANAVTIYSISSMWRHICHCVSSASSASSINSVSEQFIGQWYLYLWWYFYHCRSWLQRKLDEAICNESVQLYLYQSR